MNRKKPVIHDSKQGGPRKPNSIAIDSIIRRSVALPNGALRLGNAQAAGDYVRQEIVRREEFAAQHGPVRILWKDGKRVA